MNGEGLGELVDISGQGWRVLSGSCLDRLPELADSSIDAVVCDPPYELGFMGKRWDSSGIAFDVRVWAECFRVLKPGGHLLAFGGTRTWHRIAVAIEDAGFDIRDSIAWLYGSGFPKSLDVSKAIDKGTGENRARQLRFTEWMCSTGVSQQDCANAIIGFAKNIESARAMAQHYFSDKQQPAIATADVFDAMRHLLPEVPEEIERLVAERTGIEWTAYKNREVIGQKTSGIANKDEGVRHTIGASKAVEVDITAPATPDAQKWQGWGTALKPAFEPVIVARKPLIGTVAENVLTHGTGALNIDGARIGTGTGETRTVLYPDIRGDNYQQGKEAYSERGTVERVVKDQGRWPSNVMLDEVTAALVDEQSGVSQSPKAYRGEGYKDSSMFGVGGVNHANEYGDTGGASRFFYVAKASRRDRNEGLNLCACDKLGTWEKEGQQVTHPADMDQSTQRDTGAFGIPNSDASEWNTSSFGKDTTEQSSTETKSTTSTGTNLTTTSETLSPSIQSLTKEFIQGANSEAVSGGNPAKFAESQNPSPSPIGTSAEKGGLSTAGVDHATLELLPNQNGGAHQCKKCGGIVGGHPTVKPTDLMRQLVRLVTPPGGVVLDPFTGSGSTGKAAILEGFEFIGCELTDDYLPIIEGRLNHAVGMVEELAAEAEVREAETLF